MAAKCGLQAAYAPGGSSYRPETTPFRGNRLTSDPHRFNDHRKAVEQNPDLAVGGVTFGWLHAAYRSIDRLKHTGCLEAVNQPVLLVNAGADKIVSAEAQYAAAERLPNGRIITIPDARHEILKERDDLRNRFWLAFDRFMAEES